MKTLIVYFSKYGNTQQVAEAIGDAISQARQTNGRVQVIPLDQIIKTDLQMFDLIIMGTPTHKINLPKAVRPIIDQLPRKSLRGSKVAYFDTSYKMSVFLAQFTAAKKLSGKLRKLAGKQIIPPETFHVMEREGPLYPGEIERAQKWAETILARVSIPNE